MEHGEWLDGGTDQAAEVTAKHERSREVATKATTSYLIWR